jgi:hypothetical protein
VSTRPQQLVFGTGAIGLALTEALQRRGQTGIELVNRSGSAPVVDAVEVWSAVTPPTQRSPSRSQRVPGWLTDHHISNR